MPWFAQGIDAADGTLSLQVPLRNLWPASVAPGMDIKQSQKVIEAIIAMHKRLSAATGGLPLVPLSCILVQRPYHPPSLGRL